MCMYMCMYMYMYVCVYRKYNIQTLSTVLHITLSYIFHNSLLSAKVIPLELVTNDLDGLSKDNLEDCEVESPESNAQSFETEDNENKLLEPKETLLGKFKLVIRIKNDVTFILFEKFNIFNK